MTKARLIGLAVLGLIIIALWFIIVPAWQQTFARKYGGTITVTLPDNYKFSGATWKDDQLWYEMRPFRPGETAESWQFVEDSRYGVLQGRVIFNEKAN